MTCVFTVIQIVSSRIHHVESMLSGLGCVRMQVGCAGWLLLVSRDLLELSEELGSSALSCAVSEVEDWSMLAFIVACMRIWFLTLFYAVL
jgi:hypothetical protein